MKKATKYIVLSISCIICFVVLAVMIGLLSDIGSLSYPATLLLPMLSYSLLIGGLVILTIWAFKFSNDKAHLTFLIISLSLIFASVLVFCSAKIVNPIISKSSDSHYFNITPTEIVAELETSSIEMDSTSVHHNQGKVLWGYISRKDLYTTDKNQAYAPIHYDINFDETTDQVSSISFLIDQTSPSAKERFFYHMYALAYIFSPGEKLDDISDAIIKPTELDGSYTGENFILHVYSGDKYYYATFVPTSN